MATFAKSSFNAAIYSASRPTYPKQLFDFIFHRHESFSNLNNSQPRWDIAVDLGCGTGQATTALMRFKRVIGVEPSANMIEGAERYTAEFLQKQAIPPSTKFEFIRSAAEDLSSLKDQNADLIIAAQAAHWFDWTRLWPEVIRVLRPRGTAAFWIYSELRLPDYPALTPFITEYAQGSNPLTSLGPHWQRPGRTILERHLLDIPEPRQVDPSLEEKTSKMDRIYFTGSYYPDVLPASSTRPVILRTQSTWAGLLGYLRTFSSLHTYHEQFPEDLQNPEGDIALRFWKTLIKEATGAKTTEEIENQAKQMLNLEWPVALLLVHKLG